LIGASERWAGARGPGLPRQRPSAGAGPRRAQRAALIGDLDLPELNALIRDLTLRDGRPASGNTKRTVAAVLRRLFAWAREERIIPANPALELRTGWGASVRRRVVIPSIPQVLRLARALDHFKPGLGPQQTRRLGAQVRT